MAERLVESRWRSILDNKLAGAIKDIKIHGNAGRTQISRIRVLAHRMWFNNKEDTICDYLDGLNKISKEQLEVTKVESENLIKWLKDNYTPIGKAYCFNICEEKFKFKDEPSLGGVKISEEDRHKLMVEYAARLLDGILKKLLEEGEAK